MKKAASLFDAALLTRLAQFSHSLQNRGAFCIEECEEDLRSVLGRPGGDLLFQALRLSTIGAEDFDGRVRDGIGYRLLAMTTRPAKDGTGIGDQRSVIRRDYCPRSPILKQAD